MQTLLSSGQWDYFIDRPAYIMLTAVTHLAVAVNYFYISNVQNWINSLSSIHLWIPATEDLGIMRILVLDKKPALHKINKSSKDSTSTKSPHQAL